jgi:3-deoxy-D-manno-octulosonic-acid transferase
MYLFLYNISLFLFTTGVRIAAIKNLKAKQWLAGRKGVFDRLEQTISKQDKIIWFHCASLGEFEQGRPVIEKIKTIYPGYKILITFFSPSGYEVRKNYNVADYIFYLPIDSPANAKKFLDIVHPSLVVFVKYEYWYHYFKNISERKTPFLLISAVFRADQPFFKWYGSLYKKMLNCFTHIFVQDIQSKELLLTIEHTSPVSIAGDTRFDRVVEIADQFKAIPAIENYCSNSKVIIAGSTWPDDEKMLQSLREIINENSIKLIIAPHEIGKDHITDIQKLFPSALLYSQLSTHNPHPTPHTSHLIIDTIGILSRLYKYAYITYIGGGFTRDGIHNSLEAAVYGKPVLFGPVYSKYREAVELIEADGAKSFSTAEELKQIIYTLLNDEEDYNQKAKSAEQYVRSNSGATLKIVEFIQENRLLTN